MGTKQAQEIDAWLRDGGIVITASDRAARAISASYHGRRLAEGRRAWAAPPIVDWQRFASDEWERRAADGRLILNPLQEKATWSEILTAAGHSATMLPESRDRLAAMAMEGHALLCRYASRLLDKRARSTWTNDAGAFSNWLAAFEDFCVSRNAVSASRVALDLIPILEHEADSRAPLLLAGFDRIHPLQDAFFSAWGEWHRVEGGEPAETHFYAARDAGAELTACALWCGEVLAARPDARLLVVTQEAATRRGEIERALIEHCGGESTNRFEFSLGVPLGDVTIGRSAILILRWLTGSLEEHLLDWLFGAGHFSRISGEALILQARMRDLRRRGLQRTHWTLDTFLRQMTKSSLPVEWVGRMTAAQQRLHLSMQGNKSPLEWADLVQLLLSDAGWPGAHLASSEEFQAAQRVQQVVDLCGSLGFDGRKISWKDFLSELERAVSQTLFTPESLDAPILIAGPSESAGLTADAIWFLGGREDAWPSRGTLHPLIPSDVQRETGMPHGSPQLDWNLAKEITDRVSVSAPNIYFSYPHQVEGVDGGPSRIVTKAAGLPETMPLGLSPPLKAEPLTILFEDKTRVPLFLETGEATDLPFKIRGGSKILNAQSNCGFKGIAVGRLGAESWELADAGLSPSVRGQLLHEVMHTIWGGPPNGIRSLNELLQLADRTAFVAAHVSDAMKRELPEAARELMPKRYLELEEARLTRLISEWLEYEAARLPFTVIDTELKTETSVGDLRVDLRLDRIDRLNDGSMLVIDYKTGEVSQKSWDLPRPEDVQLPLYGGFALSGRDLGGLVFAKIRSGDLCFAGRVGDVEGTLGHGLKNSTSLKKSELEIDHLIGWRTAIEQLVRDYVNGRADVDPRDPRETCGRCGLQSLCRIHERPDDGQKDDWGDADG